MARYVAQSKYLEKLKTKEETCNQAFKSGKFLMFSEGRPLLNFAEKPQGQIVFTNFTNTEEWCGENFVTKSALIGIAEETEDAAMFACQFTSPNPDSLPAGTRFTDMRTAIMRLPANESTLVSRGYSLLNWLAVMKFCPRCTAPLKRNASGTMLSCDACPKGTHHYPVTHPVAITRVEDPTGEKVLLVRQPRHPPGMYSCIAGFLETAESLEEAVRREVAEEAGIVVGKVDYFDSQTWALPQNSLMLACTTRALPGSTELDIDTEELEAANWFTKDEVRAAYERIVSNPTLIRKNEEDELIIPPSGAIAHHLLKAWIGL